MRICVNEILKKYIFSSGFDEEQDAKDACKPLCDSLDYEVTEVRVCLITWTFVRITVILLLIRFFSILIMMKSSRKCITKK